MQKWADEKFRKSIVTLLTDDAHLGRLDYASLPDQTLMEMLVEGFTGEVKKRFQTENGMFLDVCAWNGVTCDHNHHVVVAEIDQCDGSVAFEYIPPKTTAVILNNGKLSGSLLTNTLPKEMTELDVCANRLQGTVDFTAWPDSMKCINLAMNNFTGSAVLDRLPQALELLNIQRNNFSGSLNLSNLPPRLISLDVSSNAFGGAICLENIPDSFSVLNARSNRFGGVAVLPLNTDRVFLEGSGVTSVVDEEGRLHPSVSV